VALDDPGVVVAPARGVWHTPLDIGASVRRDDLIGRIGESSVRARRDGVLVGLARDGLVLPEGAPLAEIAPEGALPRRGLDPAAKILAKAALAAIKGTTKRRTPKHIPPAR
jgi:hypothetical protein